MALALAVASTASGNDHHACAVIVLLLDPGPRLKFKFASESLLRSTGSTGTVTGAQPDSEVQVAANRPESGCTCTNTDRGQGCTQLTSRVARELRSGSLARTLARIGAG